MSEIKVNKVSPATGTAITLGDSGDTFTVPSGATIVNSGTATGFGGGKVLQVVATHKTDTASVTSSSFVDLSGMSVTITPSATSSKILVMVNALGSAWQDYTAWRIVDGSGNNITNFVGDANGSARRSSGRQMFGTQYSTIMVSLTMSAVDEPNSTSAQTYKMQWQTESNTAYFNRGYTDGTATNNARGMSSIIAMEIGA